MVSAISRAGFLRGRFNSDSTTIRPPWAVFETELTDQCMGLASCVDACPEGIIIKGRGGIPEISFASGECTFCGDCAKACPVGLLGLVSNKDEVQRPHWELHLSVSDVCISDKGVVCHICPEKCDAKAIGFDRTAARGILGKPNINQSICTGCGACIAPCPVGALSLSTIQHNEAA
ncbi:MAG: ferredoxin-type protein NapF [Rhodospirillales bacterium]|nr:ferredoxin-type protein NapF [Rhodospirillales bacterium]